MQWALGIAHFLRVPEASVSIAGYAGFTAYRNGCGAIAVTPGARHLIAVASAAKIGERLSCGSEIRVV